MLFNWYVDVDSWNKTRYAFFIRPVGNSISTSQYIICCVPAFSCDENFTKSFLSWKAHGLQVVFRCCEIIPENFHVVLCVLLFACIQLFTIVYLRTRSAYLFIVLCQWRIENTHVCTCVEVYHMHACVCVCARAVSSFFVKTRMPACRWVTVWCTWQVFSRLILAPSGPRNIWDTCATTWPILWASLATTMILYALPAPSYVNFLHTFILHIAMCFCTVLPASYEYYFPWSCQELFLLFLYMTCRRTLYMHRWRAWPRVRNLISYTRLAGCTRCRECHWLRKTACIQSKRKVRAHNVVAPTCL